MAKKNSIEFEDMNLQVGVRLQILQNANDRPVVRYSSLIGFVTSEYILLKLPDESGAALDIEEGASVVVRVFSGVSVFTFDSRVESVVRAPRSFLMMSFPSAIHKVGLRKAVRVKTNLPVQVLTPLDTDTFKMATLSDVSLSGALISTNKPLGALGDVVNIAFDLHDQASSQAVTVATTASIRSLQQAVGSTANGATFQTVYSHGINFHDIDAGKLRVLQNFVYETLLIHRN
jgi:c-di-GMP-binding flagellar brake protein YcgR